MPSIVMNNGRIVGLFSDSNLVANLLTNEINFDMSPIDTSTKDSGGDKDILPGQRSFNFSCEGLFNEAAGYGFTDLYAKYRSESSFTILYGTGVTGDLEYSGTAFLTSLSRSAGNEESESFSASFEGTGTPTEAAA